MMGTAGGKCMYDSFLEQSFFFEHYLVNIYHIVIICDKCHYCVYLQLLLNLLN